MGRRSLIVWDLDDTLGDFRALEGARAADAPVRIRSRPGIAGSLRALGRAGFDHAVLTTAAPLYAEVALRGAGLREFFARVEGRGQRRKGDAAGVAAGFGIAPCELADRVLFVGDRLDFDEPDDPEVVFHLEPWALTRPAAELTRLVLHLRRAGRGSIRDGFRRFGQGAGSWRVWKRRPPMPVGQAVLRRADGLGPLALLERAGACPVVGFAEPPAAGAVAGEHEVIPSRVAAEVG